MHWSTKVDTLLTDRNLSKQWLADAVGVSGNTLRTWLSRRSRTPEWAECVAIAEALGVDPFWLFNEAADWPPRASSRDVDTLVDEIIARRREAEQAQAMTTWVMSFGDATARYQLLNVLRALAQQAKHTMSTGAHLAPPAPEPPSRRRGRAGGDDDDEPGRGA